MAPQETTLRKRGEVPKRWRAVVVANETLGEAALLAVLRDRVRKGHGQVHLIVPSTPLAELQQPLAIGEQLAIAGENPGFALARWRLRRALDDLLAEGIPVTGDVGDPDPFRALSEALAVRWAEEVILSVLGDGSVWLAADLPHRVREAFQIPVTVVAAGDRPGRLWHRSA